MQSSQAMANSVVRYLVEKNEIPVYRIFVMGMGNAKVAATEGSKSARGNRVEISLMKNNVDQLASAQSSGEMGSSNAGSSYSTQPTSSQPATQPSTQSQQQTGTMNPNQSSSPQQ